MHDKDLTKKIRNQRREINELLDAVSALKLEVLELQQNLKDSKGLAYKILNKRNVLTSD